MAFDIHRQKTVLYGGMYNGGNTWPQGTWVWDSSSWTQVLSLVNPHPRYGHALAYDAQRQETIMFGGHWYPVVNPGYIFFTDTMRWNGSNWTTTATSGPPPRIQHAMAYHEGLSQVLLFGGYGPISGQSPPYQLFSDMWAWNGTSWTQMPQNAVTPSPRRTHGLAYDKQRQKLVLFGGWDNIADLPDTWEWSQGTWSFSSSTGPGARSNATLVYSDADNRTILIGGFTHNFGAHGDSWAWDGLNWVLVSNFGPPPRVHTAAVYDTSKRSILLFGGNAPSSSFPSTGELRDTWELSSAASFFNLFGEGCGFPPLTLDQDISAPPRVGHIARALVQNVPSSISFMAIGVSRTNLNSLPTPVSLTPFGMPGCRIFQSCDSISNCPSTANGSTTFSLSVPNIPSLIGMHAFLQSFAFAPLQNAGGTVTSNALTWIIRA